MDKPDKSRSGVSKLRLASQGRHARPFSVELEKTNAILQILQYVNALANITLVWYHDYKLLN